MNREIISLAFVGGLGDVLSQIFRSDPYLYLSSVQHPVDVLLLSPNPYIAELFQYHPNRKNIRLHTMDMYPEMSQAFFSRKNWSEEQKSEFKKNFLREQFGDAYFIRRHLPLPEGSKQTFYPSLMESFFLSQKKGYAVIQPFSSNLKKDMPVASVKYVADLLVQAGKEVLFVVRDNVRTLKDKVSFEPKKFLQKEVISKIKFPRRASILEISVPAVIQLIKKADFFAGSDSAFVKAAWYFNLPNLFLLPDFLAERPVNREKIQAQAGNYYGIGRSITHFKVFSEFREEALKAFMKTQGVLGGKEE